MYRITENPGDGDVKNRPMNNIVKEFLKVVEELRSKKIIHDKDLKSHTESNLHSWLQYCLIRAGDKEGLFAIPEVKLRFPEKPIDPNNYGLVDRKRKRHFSRVDVAFYEEDRRLAGVSEIFTMDEAHGSLPTRRLAKAGHYWLTPRDSLIHMTQHASPKPGFIILVTVLVKESPRIYWKTGIIEIDSKLEKSKNYYNVFKKYWVKFKEEIGIDASLLIVKEDGIEVF